ENLHRAELTKLERAEQIDEWRELMTQAVSSSHPADRGQRKTAEALGVSLPDVQRAEKIASISPEAKAAAQEAGIDDNQSKLLEVAKAPAEQQVAKVYELKGVPLSRNWRDQFQTIWGKGTEDDHAWAREYIDSPIMDARYK